MEQAILNKKHIKDKAWKLLVRLFKEANKDKYIDFDERRILRATDQNVTILMKYIEKSWLNNYISELELQKITFLISKIRDDAISLALYDEVISDQEKALLDIINDMSEELLELYYV